MPAQAENSQTANPARKQTVNPDPVVTKAFDSDIIPASSQAIPPAPSLLLRTVPVSRATNPRLISHVRPHIEVTMTAG